MSVESVNDRLERALHGLEKAIDNKVISLEAENTRLRAEIIKLKQEVKMLSAQRSLVNDNVEQLQLDEAPKKPRAKKPMLQMDDAPPAVQLSLSELKKMVS
jgi:predicted RNase H-like nuclease (RuvC/YqgF family)